MGSIRQQREQLVGQPTMAADQRWMLGAGQPLPQRDHDLHACAVSSHGTGDGTVECIWVNRRVEEQPVHSVHRGGNLLNVKHIGDGSLASTPPKRH